MRSFVLTVVCLLSAATPRAQEPDEKPVLEECAKKLNAFATHCLKANYPRRAREIWLEVISEYDPNDDVARKALGFVKLGTAWAPDPAFQYPDKEIPDAAIANLLNKKWHALGEEVGKSHRDLAQKLKDAGKEARAKYHFERALRFLPTDAKLAAVSEKKSFEGFYGDDVEITILKRSRLIAREIATQLGKTYPVQNLPAEQRQPVIARAAVLHSGVKSEHYTVWGDWEPEVLGEAAQMAERAFAVCKVAFAGYEGFPPPTAAVPAFAFFKERETRDKVLQATGVKGEELKWALETAAGMIGSGNDRVFAATAQTKDNCNDNAVRLVVWAYSGLSSDALKEGLGHAIVGMFFGQNLLFTVDKTKKKQQHTVAGKPEEEAHTIPDLKVWEELLLEMAYQHTAVPAGELPLITAAKFSNEARLKAWSFCDYLLRRDPALLRTLDRTRGQAKSPQEVGAKFSEKAAGLSLELLDEAWRRFWTDDTPLIRAVKQKVAPLESVSKAAPEWLEEFNKLRQDLYARLSPKPQAIGWNEQYSQDCKQHVDYLKANPAERGAAAEQTQKPTLRGASNPGRVFAEQALVATNGPDAKKAMERWVDWPGYRDAVINPNVDTIGLYVDGPIAVLDVSRGMSGSNRRTAHYPLTQQTGIPSECTVKDLGPELEQWLKAKGKANLKVLGYPMTYHSYGPTKNRDQIQLDLKVNDKDPVEGIVYFGDDGTNRRSGAPGMVVFFPLQPLKRGTLYKGRWLGVNERPVNIEFTTK